MEIKQVKVLIILLGLISELLFVIFVHLLLLVLYLRMCPGLSNKIKALAVTIVDKKSISYFSLNMRRE